MDSIYLSGADDVRSAGNTIRNAADEMRSAASSMQDAAQQISSAVAEMTQVLREDREARAKMVAQRSEMCGDHELGSDPDKCFVCFCHNKEVTNG